MKFLLVAVDLPEFDVTGQIPWGNALCDAGRHVGVRTASDHRRVPRSDERVENASAALLVRILERVLRRL